MLRARLIYLAVLISVFTFFFCFNGYLSSYVLIAALLLPFFSLLLSLPGLWGIKIELSPRAHSAEKGERLPIKLTVSNRFPLISGQISAWFSVRNTLTGEEQTERLFFTAGPQPLTISHEIVSVSCGHVICGLKKGRLYDYLGIFAFPLRLPRQSSALFYPTVYEPALSVEQSPMPDNEGERYSSKTPGHDPSEVFGLREYREGDRVPQIHWKLSQKVGEIMVRQFSLPVSDHPLFLLSLNDPGTEADALLDAFASLSHFLTEQAISHRVGFLDQDGTLVLRETATTEDFHSVLEEILLAGCLYFETLPEEIPLPEGVSHTIYLCCVPEASVISHLHRQTPSTRLSILTTSGESAARLDLPENCELTVLQKGKLLEALNGFRL